MWLYKYLLHMGKYAAHKKKFNCALQPYWIRGANVCSVRSTSLCKSWPILLGIEVFQVYPIILHISIFMGSHCWSDRPKRARWMINIKITPILQCLIFSSNLNKFTCSVVYKRSYLHHTISPRTITLIPSCLLPSKSQISLRICTISTIERNLLDIKILLAECLNKHTIPLALAESSASN